MVRRALVAFFVVASGTAGAAQVTPWPPPRSADAEPRTNIVCGTRVFRADRTIDQKIAKAVPPGTFTLRTVQPTVCRDTFATPTAELRQRLPIFLGPKR